MKFDSPFTEILVFVFFTAIVVCILQKYVPSWTGFTSVRIRVSSCWEALLVLSHRNSASVLLSLYPHLFPFSSSQKNLIIFTSCWFEKLALHIRVTFSPHLASTWALVCSSILANKKIKSNQKERQKEKKGHD